MAHILIVEDDWRTHEMFRLLLEASGYQVSIAPDAQAALALLDEGKVPHLFILDVRLPGMDGMTLCKILRVQENTAGTPILMVSARIDAQSVRDGMAAGADDYLTKPLLLYELRERVRALVRDQR